MIEPPDERAERPPSDFGQAMRGGIAWSTIAFVASRAITFLSILVLARLLDPQEFGIVAAVLAFVSLMEVASDIGMGSVVVYEQERGVTRRLHVAFTVNLMLAIILTATGVLLAPVIASFFHLEHETGLFRLGALNLLAIGFGNIHDSVLRRDLDFRRRAIPQVVRSLVRSGVSIVLAVVGMGAEALLIGVLAGTAAWAVVQWLLTSYRPRLIFDRQVVRSMAAYGGAAASLEVLSAVATRVDVVVIGRVLGERALGLYSIAFRLPELLIDSVTWNISLVAFPALSRVRAVDERKLSSATLQQLRYQALYALPVGAGLAVLATPLVDVLFSAKWHAAGAIMSAVAVGSAVIAIAFPLGDVFKAIGRQRVLVALNLVFLPLFVLALVVLAPTGLLTVAWGRTAALTLYAMILVGTVMQALQIDMRSIVAATAPAVVCAAGVIAGAKGVRVAWPDTSALELLASTLAGATGGALALRGLAPDAAKELCRQLSALLPKRRTTIRARD